MSRKIPSETPASTQLRFGILVGGPGICDWQMRSVRYLVDSGLARLCAVVVDRTGADDDRAGDELPHQRSVTSTPSENRLFRVFARFSDAKSTRTLPLEEIDLGNARLFRRSSNASFELAETAPVDLSSLEELSLDVILNFGGPDAGPEFSRFARYGLWSFQYGDPSKGRGGPPCFWEIFDDETLLRVALTAQMSPSEPIICLREGFFKTVNFSYSKCLDHLHHHIAHWPFQVCKAIYDGHADIERRSQVDGAVPIHRGPSDAQVGVFLWRLLKNKIRRRYQRSLVADKWNIAIVHATASRFLAAGGEAGGLANEARVQWTAPARRKGDFRADPFGIRRGDDLYILFEHFDFRTLRGHIRYERYAPQGELYRCVDGGCALALSDHLSYPYLVEHEDKVYMAPECFRSGEIALYVATAFPDKWEKARTIVEGFRGIDPTIVKFEGRWWLFCTEEGAESEADLNLYIWHADDLLGDWQPHALNPVKTDIRSARPAGTPFVVDGVLYRPAQDSSETYGGALTINKVCSLSPTSFEEECVARLTGPSPYDQGIHTLSSVAGVTVIDGKVLEVSLRGVIKRTLTTAARLLRLPSA